MRPATDANPRLQSDDSSNRPDRGRLDALTSFRFFAAALIVVHHAKGYYGFLEPIAKIVPLDLGVSFFYVLSGFVLFYNYPHLETARSRRRFFLMRLARIWPLHLFVLLCCITLLAYPWTYPIGPTLWDRAIIVLLLQAWVPFQKTIFGINGVSWSVSVEMFFYAIFPLLIGNFGRTYPWKLIAIIFCIICILAIVNLSGLPPMVWGENKLSADAFAFIFPPSRLLEFFMGICACYVFTRLRYRIKFNAIGWSIIEVCVLVVTFMSMTHLWYVAYYLNKLFGVAGGKWGYESGCAPAFFILIVTFALSRGYLNKIMSSKALVFLGEISFSTYMIHVPLLIYLQSKTLFHGGAGNGASASVFVMCLVAGSALSWVLIEKPGRTFIIALYDRAAANKTASLPAPAG